MVEEVSPVSTSSWVTIIESEEGNVCDRKYVHVSSIFNRQFYFRIGCPRRERRRTSLSHIEENYDDYGNTNSLCSNVFDVLSLDRRYVHYELKSEL